MVTLQVGAKAALALGSFFALVNAPTSIPIETYLLTFFIVLLVICLLIFCELRTEGEENAPAFVV